MMTDFDSSTKLTILISFVRKIAAKCKKLISARQDKKETMLSQQSSSFFNSYKKWVVFIGVTLFISFFLIE